ncbi:MAG TPA: sigma-70 family RNA polymerase sigma factor [Firmicutes bacterium]|nr:sigma-70 family RNA polymerase sigma factor [Bacillota bacterium]
MLRIARNLLYDDYRKNNRIRQLASGERETDPGAMPEEAVIRSEAEAALQKFIAALPELQREAIILKYTFALKNKEIASVLGKSETAVSSLLHRAMQSLRNEVNTHGLQG